MKMPSNIRVTPGQIIIWTGIGLGNLDWLIDFIYVVATDFYSVSLRKACWIFILA